MLDKGSQCFTLVLDDAPMQTNPTAHAGPISAVQAARALREGCRSFLLFAPMHKTTVSLVLLQVVHLPLLHLLSSCLSLS